MASSVSSPLGDSFSFVSTFSKGVSSLSGVSVCKTSLSGERTAKTRKGYELLNNLDLQELQKIDDEDETQLKSNKFCVC